MKECNWPREPHTNYCIAADHEAAHARTNSSLFENITGKTREFNSGATRTTEPFEDYEGFISPMVIETFGRYMAKNREQADGEIRTSDNWQKGMPKARYMRSMWRHFKDVWKIWRHNRDMTDMIDPLCALFFNVQGMLFEVLISLGEPRPYIRSEDDKNVSQ